MTQAELAGEIGVSRPSLANMERGKQVIAIHHLYGLVSALGLNLITDLAPLRVQDIGLENTSDISAETKVLSEIGLPNDLQEEALRARALMTS